MEIMQSVIISAFATVGIIEVIKNFLKTEKTWLYSLIMIPLSVGCYFASECCPKWVIGGILTIGVTQECYQIIIQSVNNVVKNVIGKMGGNKDGE